MTRYIAEHLELADVDAAALRQRYWKRYGATLLAWFATTPSTRRTSSINARLPELEDACAAAPTTVRRCAAARTQVVLNNAPRAYALRVLDALGLAARFDAVISIEDMAMFGHIRPKAGRSHAAGGSLRG
jgi:putative hydrolase of the HAD superfamily